MAGDHRIPASIDAAVRLGYPSVRCRTDKARAPPADWASNRPRTLHAQPERAAAALHLHHRGLALHHGRPPMSGNPNAHCHDAVLAFVAKQMRGDEFLSRFRQLADCNDAVCEDRVLSSIRALCDKYARALPSGEGYRVSEEQFRCEIQSLAARTVADRQLP